MTKVLSLPFVVRLAFERRVGGRTMVRYDLVAARDYFHVPNVSEDEAPAAFALIPYGTGLTFRKFGNELIRPVLDEFGALATIPDVEAALPSSLIARLGEDDQISHWTDHPCAVDETVLAPEDPWLKANIHSGRLPPFWRSRHDGRAPALMEIQRSLAGWIAIGDNLFRPSGAPGLFVSPGTSGSTVKQWIPGLTRFAENGIYVDRADSASLDGILAGISDRSLSRESRATVEAWKHHAPFHSSGHTFANRTMLVQTLRAIAREAHRSTASLGALLAKTYYDGLLAYRDGSERRAAAWMPASYGHLLACESLKLRACGQLIAIKLGDARGVCR